LARSFARYLDWSPGFDRENLVVVSAFLSPEKYATGFDLLPAYRAAERALTEIPGVVSSSSASAGPLFGGGDGQWQVATREWDGTSPLPSARWFDIGPGYFGTLGIPVVRGREFRESDDVGSAAVVLVNEALARTLWPGRDPVGETLRIPEVELTLEVVGVVADVPPIVPGEPSAAEMYWPNRQFGRWGTFFVVRTAREVSGLPAAATAALLGVDPDLTLGTPRPLSSFEAGALVRPRFQAVVLLAFALAALALSAVGVYAVVSYRVEQRLREMGIRMALGAASVDVVRLVARSSLGVALWGVLLGVVGALAAGRVLGGMLEGVSRHDPLSLGAAVLLLVVSAAAASVVPAYRAARADPLSSIRAE
jgi:putative ABC transport system permease protein